MKHKIALAAVIVVAGALIAPAFELGALGRSQVTVGTLTGHVMDTAMARIPGVTVTVVNEDNRARQYVISNDSGEFTFRLSPGSNYTVSAELTGFKKKTIKTIAVRMSDSTQLNLTLEVGGAVFSPLFRRGLIGEP